MHIGGHNFAVPGRLAASFELIDPVSYSLVRGLCPVAVPVHSLVALEDLDVLEVSLPRMVRVARRYVRPSSAGECGRG